MIEIIEIQQTMRQGMTEPKLCLADDNNLYVVKRKSATLKGCVKEWVCACLGQKFGLPVPAFKLAYIDRVLLEFDADYRDNLGEGIAFASQFVVDLQEVNCSVLNKAAIPQLKDLFVFDYWIKNADRNLSELGGNPNLFYRQSTQELVVIDHNLAFDSTFNIAEHKLSHVGALVWKESVDLIFQDEYQHKIRDIMNDWSNIVDSVPVEWVEGIIDFDGFIEQIELTLQQFHQQNFWEALK